jgi:hypothetical protein
LGNSSSGAQISGGCRRALRIGRICRRLCSNGPLRPQLRRAWSNSGCGASKAVFAGVVWGCESVALAGVLCVSAAFAGACSNGPLCPSCAEDAPTLLVLVHQMRKAHHRVLTGVDIRYMRVNCSAVHTVLLGDRPHLSHELVASSDAREGRQVVLIITDTLCLLPRGDRSVRLSLR